MSLITSLYRRTATTIGIVAIASLSATGVVATEAHGAVSTERGGSSQFDTTADLMAASGLSGTVTTAGDEAAGDGSGMTYSVTSTLPAGTAGDIAVPLADGKWAVPQGLPTAPPRSSDVAAVEDVIARANTFNAAGGQLMWDSSRPTPLTGTVVHETTSAPYGVTCSTFVSMVLLGWDYNHTTYVADENTQVGYAVDFGVDPSTSKIWRANNLASWFYANGDLWLETDSNYERGDILFFSEQDPEGRADEVRAGEEDTYFGNIYHVAIYLGDGQLIHSTGTGNGVNVTTLNPELEADLSFVARPAWGAAPGGAAQTAGDTAAQAAAAAEAAPAADAAGSSLPAGSPTARARHTLTRPSQKSAALLSATIIR